MDYIKKLAMLADAIDKNPAYSEEDDREAIKEFLNDKFAELPDYFKAVIDGNVVISLMNGHYDSVKVHNIEVNRRNAHINAAMAINSINRIAKENGQPPFFEFPEIGNRPLKTGNVYDRPGRDADEANHDRELAAFRIYGFCKQVFLAGPDRSRYNTFEKYSEVEMDKELYEMSERHDSDKMFSKKYLSFDELAEMAEREVAEERAKEYAERNGGARGDER